MKKLLILLILALIAAGCAEDASSPNGETRPLEGVVIARSDDSLISGARIYVLNNNDKTIDCAVSDDIGGFTLQNVPEDVNNMTIRALHPEYEEYFSPLNVVASGLRKNEIAMIEMEDIGHCKGKLVVRTVDSLTGEPVFGVKVGLHKTGEKLFYKRYSDKSGILKVDHFCPGEYEIYMNKHQGNNAYSNKVLATLKNDSNYIEIPITEPEREDSCSVLLLVEAFDKVTEERLEFVKIEVYCDEQVISMIETYQSFYNELYLTGTYVIRIMERNHKTFSSEPIDVDCGDTIHVGAYMEKLEKLGMRLDVLNEETLEPLENVSLSFYYEDDLQPDQVKVYEKGNGRYLPTFPKYGKYHVILSKKNFKYDEFDIEVRKDEFLKITRKLQPRQCDKKLTVEVIDKETGEDMKEGTLQLLTTSGYPLRNSKVKWGMVEYTNLCPEIYYLSFSHPYYKNITRKVDVSTTDEITYEAEWDDELCCTAKLNLNIADEESLSSVKNAKVVVLYKEKLIDSREVDNVYINESLCAIRNYTIRIFASGYEDYEYVQHIPDCDTFNKNIYLTPK